MPAYAAAVAAAVATAVATASLSATMPEEIKIYTLKEVEAHTGDKDIWIVIHDRVYNVTKFLDEVRASSGSPAACWARSARVELRGGGAVCRSRY